MPRVDPTEESIALGIRIEGERNRLGWTREYFAEVLDVTPGYIADLERGRTGLAVPRLMQICQLFSCSSDYILFGKVNASTIFERVDALSPQLRAMIDQLVAQQLQIIDASRAEK